MTQAPQEPSEAKDAKEPVTRGTIYTRWFMGFLLATLLLYFLSIPFLYFSLVTGPATITFAVLALVATRADAKVTGLRVGLSMGIVVAGMSMLLAVGTFVFEDMFTELRDCQARAITITAQRECQDAYDQAYKEELERFGLTVP